MTLSWHYNRTGLRPWEESLLRAREAEEEPELEQCEDCGSTSEESNLEVWEENVLLCNECWEIREANEED